MAGQGEILAIPRCGYAGPSRSPPWTEAEGGVQPEPDGAFERPVGASGERRGDGADAGSSARSRRDVDANVRADEEGGYGLAEERGLRWGPVVCRRGVRGPESRRRVEGGGRQRGHGRGRSGGRGRGRGRGWGRGRGRSVGRGRHTGEQLLDRGSVSGIVEPGAEDMLPPELEEELEVCCINRSGSSGKGEGGGQLGDGGGDGRVVGWQGFVLLPASGLDLGAAP